MVWIQSDEGFCHEIADNQVTTIGRSLENDIFVDWKAISKLHAKIHTESVIGKGIQVYIEDCQSRNGTFVGHTPFDMVKITGQHPLHHEDYIQFGTTKKYYRFFEILPSSINPESILISKKLTQLDYSQPTTEKASDFGVSGEKFRSLSRVMQDQGRLSKELDIISSSKSLITDPHTGTTRTVSDNSMSAKPNQDQVITITYPTSGVENMNPISIHIDATPKNAFFSGSAGDKSKNSSSQHQYRNELSALSVSDEVLAGSKSHDFANEYASKSLNRSPSTSQLLSNTNTLKPRPSIPLPHNKSSSLHRTSELPSRSTMLHNSRSLNPQQSTSPYGSREYIAFNPIDERKSDSPSSQYSDDPNPPKYDSHSQLVPPTKFGAYRRKLRGDFDMVGNDRNDVEYFVLEILGKYHAARPDDASKPPVKLSEEYGWDDIEQLADLDYKAGAINQQDKQPPAIKTNQLNTIQDSDLDFILPDPISSSLLSEILADQMAGPSASVVSKLNRSITALNDLFEQMQHGSCIDYTNDVASKEIDDALQALSLGFIDNAVVNIESTTQCSFIQALGNAMQSRNRLSISNILSVALESLHRLKQFHHRTFPSKTKASLLSQGEICLISYLALDNILEYIDSCNIFIASTYERAEMRVLAHTSSLAKPIASEIDSLRKMKSDSLSSLRLSKDLRASGNLADAMRKILHSAYGRSVISRMLFVLKGSLAESKKIAFSIWKENAQLLTTKLHGMKRIVNILSDKWLLMRHVYLVHWKKKAKAMKKEQELPTRLSRCVGIFYRCRYQLLVQAFSRWRETSFTLSRRTNDVAQLKLLVYTLEAKLRELTDNNTSGQALLAERLLNRELSSINRELTMSIAELQDTHMPNNHQHQRQQHPAKDIHVPVPIPIKQRQDFIQREMQLAEARRECEYLRKEVEDMQVIANKVIDKPNRASQTNAPSSSSQNNSRQQHSKLSSKQPMKNPTPAKVELSSSSDAIHVIVLEVRRLQQSLSSMQETIKESNSKILQEQYVHVQQRLAVQYLERKLSLQSRSYSQLMKILRDKMDDQSLVQIFDAMESLVPGSTQYLLTDEMIPEDASTDVHVHLNLNP